MTKITPVEQCGAVAKLPSSPQSFAGRLPSSSWRTPSKESVARHAHNELVRAMEQDRQTHEKNAEALKANAEVKRRVNELMTAIEMPKTRRVRDGNRTRYGVPVMKTVDAGWVDDLRAFVHTDDGWDRAQQRYAELKIAYEKFADEARIEAEKAKAEVERAAEREKEQQRQNIELAKIILRYELPEESTWSDVLVALRKRDQRLDLAVAMQQTRGDWSEGFYRVSDAIGRFKLETDEDKAIANEIVSLLHDDHDDGRVFRDCSWNYGRLFETAVDQQLAADIQKAASNVENY